jgi:hypothetical protein
MFVRVKTSPNSPRKAVQIVQSRRKAGRIRQVIVRHVGMAEDAEEVDRLKKLGKVLIADIRQAQQPSLFQPDQLPVQATGTAHAEPMMVDLCKLRELHRHVRGIHEVYGPIYRELGLDDLIARPAVHRQAIYLQEQMVMARLASPGSKRHSVRDLDDHFGIDLSLPAVYRMMDLLDDALVERLNQKAFESAMGMLGGKIHLVFYDCTTLYFESFDDDPDAPEDDGAVQAPGQLDMASVTRSAANALLQAKGLRSKGFSKENRFNQTQVLLALAVTSEGLPLGYELFPGKTSEGNTFKVFLERAQQRWKPTELVVVADSAMLSQANIALLEENNYGYIVGARLKSLDRATAQQVQQHGDEASIRELMLSDYRKLVVSYDPVRARKDAHDRDKAIARIEKKLTRSKSPKSMLNAKGAGRFLKLEGDCTVQLNETAVAEASVWDGLHGVITNQVNLSGEVVRQQYHGLWQVEACFRVGKHDLRFRPIFHWTAKRIRAHVAICFMALACVRMLMYRVKLQQTAMSAEVIRRALLGVQVSVYEHTDDGQRYELPGKLSAEAARLYRTVGIKPRTTARRLAPSPR